MEDPVEQLVEEIRALHYEEKQSERLWRKLKEYPFLGIGLLGMGGACTYGVHRYKKGDFKVPKSLYLLQLRVAAQGAVVASLTAGIAYTMYRHYYSKEHSEKKL